MTNPIMKALFNGEIAPWERSNTMSAERKSLEEKIQNEKRYFIEKMSPDDCKRFDALEELYSDATLDEEDEIFAHGFTLGALLMMEIMAKKEDIIHE